MITGRRITSGVVVRASMLSANLPSQEFADATAARERVNGSTEVRLRIRCEIQQHREHHDRCDDDDT